MLLQLVVKRVNYKTIVIDILSLEVITSFTATMYVLDVIFVSLLVKDYQSNVTTALKVIDFENKK